MQIKMSEQVFQWYKEEYINKRRSYKVLYQIWWFKLFC